MTYGDHTVSGTVSSQFVQAGAVHGDVHFHSSSRTPAIPRQLTAPPAHFANRHQELAELTNAATTIVVLKGQGGVGKTALALRWLSQQRDQFPDGELYADMTSPTGEPVAPSEVLGQFLRALGVPPPHVPESLAERTTLFRSMTANRKMAVLLDNAVSAAQVRVLVPSSPESIAIVTSRRPLVGLLALGATSIQVDPLDDEGAIELLERHVGAERVAIERQPAETLARLCGGLPLALCVAAALTVSRPKRSLAWMAQELTNEERRLEVLSMDEEVSLRSTFDLSYRDLPASAAMAYQALGLHHGAVFRLELLAAATNTPVDAARTAVETLMNASLVHELGGGYYRLHRLVQAHALELATSENRIDAAAVQHRMLEWYLLATRAAGHTVLPARRVLDYTPEHPLTLPAELSEQVFALQWMERQRPDLLVAVHKAFNLGLRAMAFHLADALQPLLLVHKHYPDDVDVSTVALQAALSTGDGHGEISMRKRLARAYIRLDRFDKAGEQITLMLAGTRERGDRRGEASALKSMGMLYARSGHFERAAEWFTQALAIVRTMDKPRAEGLLLIELGAALTELGDLSTAQGHLRSAVRILAGMSTPDTLNVARARTALGMAHIHMGQHADAERELQQALEVLTELDFPTDLAWTHHAMAEHYASTGDAAAAEHHRGIASTILSGRRSITEDD